MAVAPKLLCAVALAAAISQAAAASTLTLEFTGAAPGKGPILIEVFAESRATQFPGAADGPGVVKALVPEGQAPASVTLDLPNGRYAVSAFQDQKKLGRLDLSGMFGAPTEPWGVSRNARPMFSAPRFKDAVFDLGDEGARHSIVLDF